MVTYFFIRGLVDPASICPIVSELGIFSIPSDKYGRLRYRIVHELMLLDLCIMLCLYLLCLILTRYLIIRRCFFCERGLNPRRRQIYSTSIFSVVTGPKIMMS